MKALMVKGRLDGKPHASSCTDLCGSFLCFSRSILCKLLSCENLSSTHNPLDSLDTLTTYTVTCPSSFGNGCGNASSTLTSYPSIFLLSLLDIHNPTLPASPSSPAAATSASPPSAPLCLQNRFSRPSPPPIPNNLFKKQVKCKNYGSTVDSTKKNYGNNGLGNKTKIMGVCWGQTFFRGWIQMQVLDECD